MKSPPKGFYWLLIWMGLGFLFVGSFVYFGSSIITLANPGLREVALRKDLELAVNSFDLEYGCYPLSAEAPSQEDMTLDTANSRFISALLGQNILDNRRAIVFIDLPTAKRGRGGLAGQADNIRLIDSWGNPYQLIFDTNRDSKVRNPDLSNQDPEIRSMAPEWLPISVAVFSRGEDGVLNTCDDNTTWRKGGSLPLTIYPDINPLIWIGLIMSVVGILGVLLSPRAEKIQPSPSEDHP